MNWDFLRSALDDDQVSTGDSDLGNHAADFGTQGQDHPPDVVVWPESTGDVAAVLEEAQRREIPVTAYALGTGLEGNAVPVGGGISMNMTRMDEVLDLRPEAFQIDVEPGVVGSAINEAAARKGLFFPPLPSSGDISTIGGMIANDASGMHTVKYGEVQDWVLDLEAVLADGTVITTGSRAIKSSSGYNLTDLFVGSEGTLGVVTRATLQLAGIPEQKRGGRALFETLDDAASAISDAVSSGVDVAAIELVDALSATMANDHLDLDLPDVPMVFLEFHANHGIEEEIEFARSIFEAHDMLAFEMGKKDDEMERLWQARRELAFAIMEYDPDLVPVHAGDVTVPIDRYPEIIRYTQTLGDKHDLLIPCFGHGGDGNLHYSVLVDLEDPDHLQLGQEVYGDIVRKAVELGGTSTGEHGVGLGKREYMELEHGTGGVAAMQAVKRALDPAGILNPGKIFPEALRDDRSRTTGT